MVAVAAHGPEGVQLAPGEQAVHTPVPLQTPVVAPEVHAAPTPTKVRSVQTGAPDEHSMVAVAAQGLADVHVSPCVHATHWPPALQTPAAVPAVHAAPMAA